MNPLSPATHMYMHRCKKDVDNCDHDCTRVVEEHVVPDGIVHGLVPLGPRVQAGAVGTWARAEGSRGDP